MHDWGTGDTQVQSKCVGCSFSVQVPKMEDLKKKKKLYSIPHFEKGKNQTKTQVICPKYKNWKSQVIKICIKEK